MVFTLTALWVWVYPWWTRRNALSIARQWISAGRLDNAAQAVMDAVGKNTTLMDGALNVAMQDPAMKEHVLTLFRGMKMAGAK